jgi:RNA polymerase sigma factor (sigma-70 family)
MSTDDSPTDETLWGRVLAFDASAFAEVYRRHYPRVYRHACRLTSSADEAEDVTAMVFHEAWRRRTSVRFVEGSAAGWLLATSANVVRNQVRSRLRHGKLLQKLTPAGVAEAVTADHAVAADDRMDMERAFRRLSLRDQEILSLCYLERIPLVEASHMLGIPTGTAKSRLSRARAALAAALRDGASIPQSSLPRRATS